MRNHLKHLKSEKGFTLIELLAVIVILGIIAAIAVPMIGNVISDSERKADYNDALNIIAAAKLADANNEPKSAVENGYNKDELQKYLSTPTDFKSVTKDPETGIWSINGHPSDHVGTKAETDLRQLVGS